MAQPLIVVADDEPTIRNLLKSVLAGHSVLEAEDGVEALSLVDSMGGAVDLLITDVKMPRMNGVELAHAMAARYPAVPILFISAHPANPVAASDWPQNRAFLPKPFLPQVLLRTLSAS